MNSVIMRITALVGIMQISVMLQAVDPKFDLKNKSDSSIQIQINDGPLEPVKAGNSYISTTLDVRNLKKINIHYCPTNTHCKTYLPDVLTVQCSPGSYETVYIKFSMKNGKGQAEPQKGILNKATTKGYSLSKNIKAADIQLSTKTNINRPTMTSAAIEQVSSAKAPQKTAEATPKKKSKTKKASSTLSSSKKTREAVVSEMVPVVKQGVPPIAQAPVSPKTTISEPIKSIPEPVIPVVKPEVAAIVSLPTLPPPAPMPIKIVTPEPAKSVPGPMTSVAQAVKGKQSVASEIKVSNDKQQTFKYNSVTDEKAWSYFPSQVRELHIDYVVTDKNSPLKKEKRIALSYAVLDLQPNTTDFKMHGAYADKSIGWNTKKNIPADVSQKVLAIFDDAYKTLKEARGI